VIVGLRKIINKMRFGNTSGYSQFENDGTIRFDGDATTWDDIVGRLVANKLESVAGKLQYDYDENAIIMQSGGSITNNSERLIFNFQYPHAAIVDGEMRLHVHWEQVSSNQIEFTTQYRVQSNGAAKVTSWTTAPSNSVDNSKFNYVSGTLNQITELATVDMTDAGISATVQFRFARTDSTSGDISAVFVDAHIERDTIGSRQEYVK